MTENAPDFSSFPTKNSWTTKSAFCGISQVVNTVPQTGQRAMRLASLDVSFSKGTTTSRLRTAGSLATWVVRTGVLEAHPIRTGSTTQRAVRAATKDFEKGFTLPPAGMIRNHGLAGNTKNEEKALPKHPSDQRVPFVERTPRIRAFRATASRRARAKALKTASAM